MTTLLDEQAAHLRQVATDLVMRYQFRDRNELLCYGVTVLQCYTLEALEHGPVPAKVLAGRLHVSLSTMTRVIDRLVNKQLVSRSEDPDDRRVHQIRLTAQGDELLQRIQGELVGQNREILEALPEATREHVIWAIQQLSQAVDTWRTHHRSGCSSPQANGCSAGCKGPGTATE
jgi:DNA-binding MarR family transcriptional regulator